MGNRSTQKGAFLPDGYVRRINKRRPSNLLVFIAAGLTLRGLAAYGVSAAGLLLDEKTVSHLRFGA
jgi:hypothetical protein